MVVFHFKNKFYIPVHRAIEADNGSSKFVNKTMASKFVNVFYFKNKFKYQSTVL